MRVGILALQGAFAEHAAVLEKLGAEHFEIRQRKDLETPFDGLILPGGESTVMKKLLHDLGLFEPLAEKIQKGLPVFGTCAGLILLAKDVDGGSPCFAAMDIAVKRNAYGRQLGSFYVQEQFRGIGTVPMTFIRGPYIESAGKGVEILAEVDGNIVAARQNNLLVTAFHPELSDDLSIHRYFLQMMEQGTCKNSRTV